MFLELSKLLVVEFAFVLFESLVLDDEVADVFYVWSIVVQEVFYVDNELADYNYPEYVQFYCLWHSEITSDLADHVPDSSLDCP